MNSLSTNLSRNITFDKNGYFYADDLAALTGKKKIAGIEYGNTADPMISSNFEVIYEDTAFGDLLKRKSNLAQLVEATKDANATQQLTNFMNTYVGVGVFILKTADELYWFDKVLKIPGEFSLDYCLTRAINIGVEKLKLNRMILDVTNTEALAKQTIEKTFDDQIKTRKREIGVVQTNALKNNNKKLKTAKTKK